MLCKRPIIVKTSQQIVNSEIPLHFENIDGAWCTREHYCVLRSCQWWRAQRKRNEVYVAQEFHVIFGRRHVIGPVTWFFLFIFLIESLVAAALVLCELNASIDSSRCRVAADGGYISRDDEWKRSKSIHGDWTADLAKAIWYAISFILIYCLFAGVPNMLAMAHYWVPSVQHVSNLSCVRAICFRICRCRFDEILADVVGRLPLTTQPNRGCLVFSRNR